MKERVLDAETLAAFLDGKLAGPERTRVLEQLNRSPADYELFVEAAALHRELSGDTEQPVAIHVRPQSGNKFRRAVNWLPIAAVISALVIIPLARRSEAPAMPFLDRGPLIDERSGGLGEQWTEPGWSRSRGFADDAASAEREFRAGVRLTDLIVAQSMNDLAAVKASAAELTNLLQSIDASGPVVNDVNTFATRAGPVAATDEVSLDIISHVTEFTDASPWLELGLWVEQARLAVKAGRIDLFDARAEKTLTRTLRRLPTNNTQLTNSLSRLTGLLDGGIARAELSELENLLTSIVRLSAN